MPSLEKVLGKPVTLVARSGIVRPGEGTVAICMGLQLGRVLEEHCVDARDKIVGFSSQ